MASTDTARQKLAAQQQGGNGKSLEKADPAQHLLAKIDDAVTRVLPKGVDSQRFNRILLTTLRRNPDLLKADQASLVGAIVAAAECGLEPGTHEGHCWIVGPFKNKGKLEAVFMLGYKGLVELALRSGKVSSIIARPVYEGEPFTYRETLDRTILEHEPMLDGEPKDDQLRGCYAIARLTGERAVPIAMYLSVAQIEKYRQRSKSANSPAWREDYVAMGLKTAAKRLEPWLPKSPELRTAVLADEQVAHYDGGDLKVQRDDEADDDVGAIVVNTVPDGDDDDGDVVDAEIDTEGGRPESDPVTYPGDDEPISDLRKPQLVKRLHAAGLDTDGNVPELRERWRAHIEGSSDAPSEDAQDQDRDEAGEPDPSESEGSPESAEEEVQPAPPPVDTSSSFPPHIDPETGELWTWQEHAEARELKTLDVLKALKGHLPDDIAEPVRGNGISHLEQQSEDLRELIHERIEAVAK